MTQRQHENISEHQSHNYAVIVAGGSGTRLWPLSRKSLPKQMQKFVSDKTLIDETVERLGSIVPRENIYISTASAYVQQIQELLPQIARQNIIVEPEARGTTVAFSLFSHIIHARDPEAIIFTLASDHTVTGVDSFQQALDETFAFVRTHEKHIALLGIKPTHPDSGLGYIKVDKIISDHPLTYSVEKFIEKPTVAVAKKYLKTGEYYWNAAYYCFKAATLLQAYTEADPNLTKWVKAYLESGDKNDFLKVPQKAHEIETINANSYPLALIPADFSWSDIGSWASLHDVLSKGEEVVSKGLHVDLDSTGSMVMSEDSAKLVVTVGLSNVIVVNTDDAILVMDRNRSQDIKEVLQHIKEKNLERYL